MTDKIIAIHQPNFMPWAGYFLKIAACDVFVFHDNVQLTKAGPTRRVKIASIGAPEHTQWLTVPLKKQSDFTLIKDLEISWDTDWSSKHLNQLHYAYRKSPNYDIYFPKIQQWYQKAKEFNFLSDLNIYFIQQWMQELDIQKEIVSSSKLLVSGKGAHYNLAITQYLNGTHYLSGMGGDKYQDEEIFNTQQLKLLRFDSKSYLEHHFSGFQTNFGLSLIELLMKIDIDIIKSGFSKVRI